MICAIVVAGGTGSRMQAPLKKQFLELDGLPIVSHTLMAVDRCPVLERLILVVPQQDLAWCRNEILAPLSLVCEVQLVAGGLRRQESVANGLAAVGADDGIVMIHDGVRPFVRPSLITACLAGVQATGACIPVIPATDTLKQVGPNGVIVQTLDRGAIRLAQTPQTFFIGLIRRAHQSALQRGFDATDDASVVEFAGGTVTVVPGDPENIKITTPQDLLTARSILHRRRETCASDAGRTTRDSGRQRTLTG
jgi:2-C-methyl-D-erythritol 4-phosphate cytidylyltransferase